MRQRLSIATGICRRNNSNIGRSDLQTQKIFLCVDYLRRSLPLFNHRFTRAPVEKLGQMGTPTTADLSGNQLTVSVVGDGQETGDWLIMYESSTRKLYAKLNASEDLCYQGLDDMCRHISHSSLVSLCRFSY